MADEEKDFVKLPTWLIRLAEFLLPAILVLIAMYYRLNTVEEKVGEIRATQTKQTADMAEIKGDKLVSDQETKDFREAVMGSLSRVESTVKDFGKKLDDHIEGSK